MRQRPVRMRRQLGAQLGEPDGVRVVDVEAVEEAIGHVTVARRLPHQPEVLEGAPPLLLVDLQT